MIVRELTEEVLSLNYLNSIHSNNSYNWNENNFNNNYFQHSVIHLLCQSIQKEIIMDPLVLSKCLNLLIVEYNEYLTHFFNSLQLHEDLLEETLILSFLCCSTVFFTLPEFFVCFFSCFFGFVTTFFPVIFL